LLGAPESEEDPKFEESDDDDDENKGEGEGDKVDIE
jgi:hypothetical protein